MTDAEFRIDGSWRNTDCPDCGATIYDAGQCACGWSGDGDWR